MNSGFLAHSLEASKKSIDVYQARERRIEIIKRRLLRKSMPRLQVALILSLTGLAGFLASFSLLHSGVAWMWLRYPIATFIGYGVFLLQLALWLWLQRHSLNLDVDGSLLDGVPEPFKTVENFHFGGGGNFGGAGSGGAWGQSLSAPATESGASTSHAAGFDLDLGEAWVIVIAMLALLGGLVVSFYIIYIAPALLAEILVDGALMVGLYRRVKGLEQRNWLRSAVRRTLLPAILAGIFFGVAGYTLQRAAPKAQSMGEVWNYLIEQEPS